MLLGSYVPRFWVISVFFEVRTYSCAGFNLFFVVFTLLHFQVLCFQFVFGFSFVRVQVWVFSLFVRKFVRLRFGFSFCICFELRAFSCLGFHFCF